MYDNGYIVKCRSILTNDICLSEASHKADVFLVCISYLTYSLKKCIDNLAVWKIRVNTHTHTHTHNYRASIYNKTFNLQWITGINYPGLSLSYDKSSYKYSYSAILSQKRQDIFMVRRYWGAFSAPEYRRFFVSTHNSLKSLLVFKYL